MVLNKTDFQQFLSLGGCGGLERTDFSTVSTLGQLWWFLKELIFNTVSTLGVLWWS